MQITVLILLLLNMLVGINFKVRKVTRNLLGTRSSLTWVKSYLIF